MDSILNYDFAGSSIWRIIVFFAIILFSLLIGRTAKVILNRSSERLKAQQRMLAATTLDALAKSAVFLFASIGISAGLTLLNLQSTIGKISNVSRSILLTVAIGYFLYWLAEIPADWFRRFALKTETTLDDMMSPIIRKSLRVTIVILALVQIAQTLSNKPITSIIAGLGIGGLAVALAAQDSLKNFFGSVVLFIDKPFEIGNRIVVDGHDGVVETVGLRSTKIRTLDSHLITIPNGELANKIITNIGKRTYIKRVANITVTYDTPPHKLDRAVEIVKEILDNHKGMHRDFPPKVYLSELNADSLNIMAIYWYHPPDYWEYMEFSDRFNREVLRRFNEEGIDFAFPTQTIYLAGDISRPLKIGINRLSGDEEADR
jgi:MscS family membrane protein